MAGYGEDTSDYEPEVIDGERDPVGSDHKALTDDEFEEAVQSLVSDTISFADDDVRPEQERAARYYRGEVDLTSQSGRSRAVNKVTHEVISGIMPDLIRIYTTVDRPVSFLANTQAKVPVAEQQSDYVSYVLECNNWFQLLYDNIWNALVTKVGIFRSYWCEKKSVKYLDFTRLTEDEYLELAASDADFVGDIEREEEVDPEGIPFVYYSGTVRKVSSSGHIVVENIDPDEFIVDRRATGPHDAIIQGICSYRTVDDLVASGYDRDEMLRLSSDSPTNDEKLSDLRQQRMFDDQQSAVTDGLKWVEYVDVLVRMDRDGDGIPELTRCVLLGSDRELQDPEKVDESSYSWWSPIRIPHSPIGHATADITTDLQDQGTAVLRGMLDNIYLSNTPRQWGVQNQVNLDDLSQFGFGTTIRMRQPGMAGYFETPVTAQYSLAGLEYLDKIKERRTGYSDAALGLDPKAMQSTTLMAIGSTISAARARVELIARIFGEVALKHLFKRILKLSVMHDDRKRVVRLRGEFIEVDPSMWDIDLDLAVNVGLGRGTLDEKAMALAQIAGKQEQILLQMGPDNPLCSLVNYRYTLGKMVELAGFKEVDAFFKPVPMVEQGLTDMKNQPEKPSPEMIKAQLDAQKMQMQMAHDERKLQLEMQRAQAELLIEKARAENDMRISNMKAQNDIAIQRYKAGMDYQLRQQELHAEIALEPLRIAAKAPGGQGDVPRPH